jgi:putative phosphoesterase
MNARTAIVSDVHGNLAALEAVIADIANVSPDLVIHGGDLATHGHRPAEVIDRIRDLGWPGVCGNTDEMLWSPELYEPLMRAAPQLAPLYRALFHHLAPATRNLIGQDRVKWLQTLPAVYRSGEIAVVHATMENLWKAPMADASMAALLETYGAIASGVVVYGHIHRPYVRQLPTGGIVANSGSVGLPFDGDPRASYLLIDESGVQVRRVAYDIESEVTGLLRSGYPLATWLAHMLRTAHYIPPVTQ